MKYVNELVSGLSFVVKSFSDLSVDELYEIIKSRTEIFLLEQNIICQDLDDVDRESLHCFFTDGKRVTAYLRAYQSSENEVTIGRVLTLEHKKGLGSELFKRSVEQIKLYFKASKLCVHAQTQAEKFYEKMGFTIVSDEYLEEGVPHVSMEMNI